MFTKKYTHDKTSGFCKMYFQEVLDYDHYTYNLTKANQNKDKDPEWYKLYSFKDAYGLKNTTYDSLTDLIGRMSRNRTLMQQYFR
jgi:hypothetical protein